MELMDWEEAPPPGDVRFSRIRAWLKRTGRWVPWVNLRAVLAAHGVSHTRYYVVLRQWFYPKRVNYAKLPGLAVAYLEAVLKAGARRMDRELVADILALPINQANMRCHAWKEAARMELTIEERGRLEMVYRMAARAALGKEYSDLDAIRWVADRLEIPADEIDPGDFPCAVAVTLHKQYALSDEARKEFMQRYYLPLVQRKMMSTAGLGSESSGGGSLDVEALRAAVRGGSVKGGCDDGALSQESQ